MEQSEAEINNKYIICSKCHMKYINDDEHIKHDFGYNRLNERYKNCMKCRTYNREQKANVKFNCELCGKKLSNKTKDKHVDSSFCKRTQNINRYLELIGGYNIMDEKHIANGDVDFDGVIKLEQHEKTKYNNYN